MDDKNTGMVLPMLSTGLVWQNGRESGYLFNCFCGSGTNLDVPSMLCHLTEYHRLRPYVAQKLFSEYIKRELEVNREALANTYEALRKAQGEQSEKQSEL